MFKLLNINVFYKLYLITIVKYLINGFLIVVMYVIILNKNKQINIP